MIQLGSGYEKVCEYLQKHNVNSLEEIVGMDAFHIFPRQGVTACKIRNVEFFGNVRVWGFKTNGSHKLVELGNSIFLDEKEAREYEVLQLHKRTLDQQQNIIKRRVEEINRDLDKLDYLLERYPTTESRCRFKKCCENCSHHEDGIIEGKVTCADFGKPEDCYFWRPDIEAFKKWLKEHEVG